jgi:hypothetical protein
MGLSEIVNVVITSEVKAVSRAGFGTLLIVGPNVNVNNRLEYFENATDAVAKVIGASTLEEAMIRDVFAQSPSPTRIALGAVQASKTFVFTENSVSGGTFLAYVNGTLYSQAWSSTFDGTMTALAALIAADVAVDTAVYTTGTNTLVVTPNTGYVAGVTFDFSSATGGTPTYVLTCTELAETYSQALDAILLEQPDWYGIVAATRTYAKQVLVADWTETNKKFFIAGSADLNIINQTVSGDTTSIAAYAKNQSLERTAVIFTKTAATEAPDAALFGKLLPLDPGTYTAMFKTLASVTVDTLTATQSANALAKYANVYETIGGVNIVREGQVGANEYIDIVIFIDWLTARITESVYAALVSQSKIPYTTVGIMVIKSALEGPLKIGQNRGGISPTTFDDNKAQIGGYYIEAPEFSTISTADKIARTLTDVKFTAFLSGAIHSVVINGVVTL